MYKNIYNSYTVHVLLCGTLEIKTDDFQFNHIFTAFFIVVDRGNMINDNQSIAKGRSFPKFSDVKKNRQIFVHLL